VTTAPSAGVLHCHDRRKRCHVPSPAVGISSCAAQRSSPSWPRRVPPQRTRSRPSGSSSFSRFRSSAPRLSTNSRSRSSTATSTAVPERATCLRRSWHTSPRRTSGWFSPCRSRSDSAGRRRGSGTGGRCAPDHARLDQATRMTIMACACIRRSRSILRRALPSKGLGKCRRSSRRARSTTSSWPALSKRFPGPAPTASRAWKRSAKICPSTNFSATTLRALGGPDGPSGRWQPPHA
jgi:hypothetical protein